MHTFGPNTPEGGIEYQSESAETQSSDGSTNSNDTSSTDYSEEIGEVLNG